MGKAARKVKNANISGGWKMIKGRGNLCVGYVGGNSYIRNRRCNGGNNVQWRFIKYAGRYIIQNKSGKVLRIYSIYIYSYPRQNNTPQRWLVESIGGGKYMIHNQSSHKCLYCAGYTSYNYHYNHKNCNKNSAHFQYYIVNVRKVKNANIPSGWKMIKTRGRYCLGYVGRHTYVRNRNCNGANNVQWRFIKYGGRYIIQNKSGYVLRIYSSYIYAWKRQNNTPQRFLMDSIGGGRYLIKNQNSKKCIQNNSYSSNNYHYNQYPCKINDARQQFYVVNVKKIKLKVKKSKRKSMKYGKNKNLKFMKGKYTFNLKTGTKFCKSKCSNNKSSNEGVCFKNGVKKCKSCSYKGNKKTAKGKENDKLCSIVCKSINNQKCDFYAYLDNKKKVINKKLLNKFGKIFVTKFLQKNR